MVRSMSIENQIKAIYPSLTKSQRDVAKYVMNHLGSVCDQTLATISKNAKVGEATTMRFLYKLGYESVAQFKIAIAKETITKQTSEEDDGSAEYFVKSVNQLMVDALHANREEDVQKVIDWMEQASHIYFFGNGTSGLSCQVAAYRFFRAGVRCECVTDTHMMQMCSSLAKSDALFFAVSLSGDNVDLLSAIKRAKENTCKVVTVSGHPHSLLSQLGDVNLVHPPIALNEKSYYGGAKGIFVQEFILEMIFLAYDKRHHDEVEMSHQLTTTATENHHEGLKPRGV